MSIFAPASRSLRIDRPSLPGITRRAAVAMLGCLGLSRGTSADSGSPRPVRTLDPTDPDALELARLYDLLRASHGPEIRAQRSLLECHREADDAEPPLDDVQWKAHCADLAPLQEAVRVAARARSRAYHDLIGAVIEAHGGGDPRLSEWYAYGVAHRVVRVGDRVYSVVADYDADWPEDEGDHGMLVLSVVDL